MSSARLVFCLLLSVLTTIIVTMAFSMTADFVSQIFVDCEYLAWAFPLAGLATWLLYKALRVPFSWSTKHVVGNAEKDQEVTLGLIPAIFAGTCATLLVGGSVGKEAAALQMGGGVAAVASRRLHVTDEQSRLVCACSLACALSLLLGAPIASALFAIELLEYAPKKPVCYVAVVVSAFVAKVSAWCFALDALNVAIALPELNVRLVSCAVLVIGVCSVLAICFCSLMPLLKRATSRPKTQLPALLTVGVAASIFIVFFDGRAFAGTGMEQALAALAGELTGPYFLGKALFTLILLGFGFKGGEIMPTLCIGATCGAFLGDLIGVDLAFMAALGLVAYFSACTNCPLAATFLACEAFGAMGAGWYLACALLAFCATYRFGFYENTHLYPNLVRAVVGRGGAQRASEE